VSRANQWNELVDNVADSTQDVANRVSRSEPGRAVRKTTERIERVVRSRPANLLWRGLFLSAAGAAMVTSLGLLLANKKHEGLYVGQWVPTLLLAALWGQVVQD
jgi:hypothetical protein